MLVLHLWVESSFEFLLRHVWDVWDTLYTWCPKKSNNRKKSYPKLSTVGLNFPIKMSWECLILLILSDKGAETFSRLV